MVAEALTELEALLVEERDAIRRLDGQAVLEFARRKQALMATLAGQRDALGPRDATRLQGLTPALRQNGVLLAHARDVLRDAIAVLRRETAPPTYATTRNILPLRRSLLSVRG
jgi:flagellar biosynthesis/type III secretory pathway chaperone